MQVLQEGVGVAKGNAAWWYTINTIKRGVEPRKAENGLVLQECSNIPVKGAWEQPNDEKRNIVGARSMVWRLGAIGVHIPHTGNVGIIHVPLQGVPP